MIEPPIQDVYLGTVYTATHAGQACSFTFRPRPGDRSGAPKWPAPWAIITAYNPMSIALDAGANTHRAAELMELLHARRLASEPAENGAPDGAWREPGRIIFGLTRDAALDLGRRFRQRAIVWCPGERVGLLDCLTERWTVRPIYPLPPPKTGI